MENILSIVYGIAWILGAIGAALSVIYVVYSGYLFMSSQGDPQRMAQARTSIIGVAIGLVLFGWRVHHSHHHQPVRQSSRRGESGSSLALGLTATGC